MATCLNSGLLASSLKKLHPSLKWTLNTVSWYCIRKKYWQPTDTFKTHELLSVKARLTNEASKGKGHRKQGKLKWNAETHWLSLKASGLSVFSSYTGTKQTGTLNLRHTVKVQLLPGIHSRETNWMFGKKATTMLRTGTTESTCTPHKLTIYFFF